MVSCSFLHIFSAFNAYYQQRGRDAFSARRRLKSPLRPGKQQQTAGWAGHIGPATADIPIIIYPTKGQDARKKSEYRRNIAAGADCVGNAALRDR